MKTPSILMISILLIIPVSQALSETTQSDADQAQQRQIQEYRKSMDQQQRDSAKESMRDKSHDDIGTIKYDKNTSVSPTGSTNGIGGKVTHTYP